MTAFAGISQTDRLVLPFSADAFNIVPVRRAYKVGAKP